MNREEFIASVNEWDGKPASFDDDYNAFKEYQSLAYKTLMAFHNVCENCGINYVLADGSLLGAVRDGGQIPWDYDIDVLVPFCQKDKLCDALYKNLPDDFYFYSPDVNKKCRHLFMRVVPKGYRSEEIHVDVFYYIGAPDTKEQREMLVKKIEKTESHRFYKFVNAQYDSYGRVKKYIRLMIFKVLSVFSNTKSEYLKLSDLAREYPVENSEYITRYDSFNRNHSGELIDYYAKDFSDTKLIEVDGGCLRIPVNYDRILRATYGEYTLPPSLKDCVAEMTVNCRRLKSRAKID